MPPLVQVSRDSQVTWPSRDYPRMDSHISPPCPSILGFPSNLAIPGLSQDGQPYAPLVQVSWDSQVTWPSRDYPRMDSRNPPLVQVSRDSQVTWPSRDSQVTWPSWDYPRMDSRIPPPCPSIPGFPSNLAILGLSQNGQVTWESRETWTRGVYGCPSCDNPGMARFTWESQDTWTRGYTAAHPGIIPGWPSYLGIPGYLDRGGAYDWPSWDNPGMAKLLGNPGILGQGGGIWLSILG